MHTYERCTNHKIPEYEFSDYYFRQFREEYGRESADTVYRVLDGWKKNADREETSPLWYRALSETKNIYQRIRDIEKPDIHIIRSLDRFEEFNQKLLKERFGNSILLYRGVNMKGYSSMRKDNYTYNKNQVWLEHRPLESWTMDPETAIRGKFIPEKDRKILRKKFSTEEIFASHITFPTSLEHHDEKEFIVKSNGPRKYQEEDITESWNYDPVENAEWALKQFDWNPGDYLRYIIGTIKHDLRR